MVALELPTNATLAEVLSARARRTPRDRLFVDIIGGFSIVCAAIWARHSGWVVVAAAAACLAMYGLWALAEVRLMPRPSPDIVPHTKLWRAAQQSAAVIGMSAFLLFLFAALGVALGPIKS